jgi:hypothetical protein
MPPGGIVMRAIVSVDGKIVGLAHHTVRKVKKALRQWLVFSAGLAHVDLAKR